MQELLKVSRTLLIEIIIKNFILIAPKLLINDISNIERLRLRNPLTSAPTLFIKPIENIHNTSIDWTLTINRLRHASDSDLPNEKKSVQLSSFFQTDV
jgi:hypothetical protein